MISLNHKWTIRERSIFYRSEEMLFMNYSWSVHEQLRRQLRLRIERENMCQIFFKKKKNWSSTMANRQENDPEERNNREQLQLAYYKERDVKEFIDLDTDRIKDHDRNLMNMNIELFVSHINSSLPLTTEIYRLVAHRGRMPSRHLTEVLFSRKYRTFGAFLNVSVSLLGWVAFVFFLTIRWSGRRDPT